MHVTLHARTGTANIIHTLTCSYNHTQVYSYILYSHAHKYTASILAYLATLHEHTYIHDVCSFTDIIA